MIKRYTLINISSISKTFKFSLENLNSIYNAYPTKKMPIVTLENNGEIKFEFWGTSNLLSNNNDISERLVSVDLSKVRNTNIYFSQFKLNRCLIPCDGFFLWKNLGGKDKTPYYFKYVKDKLIYCLGIKEVFEDLSGNTFSFFYFISSQSDKSWASYTKRIPLFFDIKYLDLWFSSISTIDSLYPFMKTIRFNDFSNYIVSPYFENNNIDNSSLIDMKKNMNQNANYRLFD